MITYISILRGINVSGHKIIKMAALKLLYENLGFQHVKTYVQSGNVIFQSKENNFQSLGHLISDQILKVFGFEVPVILLTVDQLKSIIENNPLKNDPTKNSLYLHVTFLASQPIKYDSESILSRKQEGEEIMISENAVYLYCPNGYGNTKLTNTFLENKLKVGVTTRNWKSTNEILKIAMGLV